MKWPWQRQNNLDELDIHTNELLDVLRINGHLMLRTRQERDFVYKAAKLLEWNGVEKVSERELRLVSW